MVLVADVQERIAPDPTGISGGEEGEVGTSFTHRPVLLRETVGYLGVSPGGVYIDCTVGEGGHSFAILEAATPGGRLLAIDLDPQALQLADTRLRPYDGSFILIKGSYVHLKELAAQSDFTQVDGILLDLGLSSLQLRGEGRGFSFQRNDPLDMRFDPDGPIDAADIVNTYPADELERILATYGEERRSRAISRAVLRQRPIKTTQELADLIVRVAGGRHGRIHPATRSFQALRIAVNSELDNLTEALPQAVRLLKPGGRLVVISYHSLEDRIAKTFLASEGKASSLRILTRKVVFPSLDEVRGNPRSRSARLRAAERLGDTKP